MKTNVALVLDQSGSMGSNLVETIGGFNEQLETLRQMQTPDHEVRVTFTVFGSKVDVRMVNQPINEVLELTEETYKPRGWTALYDAVGATIVKLEDESGASEEDAFLVMIFSDGEENQSKEYSAASLSAVINRLKTTGKWTFTYLGSNQDLATIQSSLGVEVGNLCSYRSDSRGTKVAFQANSSATRKYFSARASGQSCCNDLYSTKGSITDAEAVVAESQS